MARISATLFLLLLSCASCSEAQGQRWRWASARERKLKGAVRVVAERCSGGNSYEAEHKYEFDRDGKLTTITSPHTKWPLYYFTYPGSYKITKRDGRGRPLEVSFFIKGDLDKKERYEVEYDGVGNWTKRVTRVMRDYEAEGSGTAGKWFVEHTCERTIEYYSQDAAEGRKFSDR